MSMFNNVCEELRSIDNGYKKVRNKIDSALSDLNKIGMFSPEGIDIKSRLGDSSAELRILESKKKTFLRVLETMHNATPFSQNELRKIKDEWDLMVIKGEGIEQQIRIIDARLVAKNILANLTGQIEEILDILQNAIVDLSLPLVYGRLPGNNNRFLP